MKKNESGDLPGKILKISIVILTIIIVASSLYSLRIKIEDKNNKEVELAEQIEVTKERTENVTTRSGEREQDQKIEENNNSEISNLIDEKSKIISENIKEAKLDPGIPIDQVKISRGMDLTVRTGLSKENFKLLISTVKADTSKFFYENADLIYDLCKEYQLNEIFFCGLISAESGWDIAANHRRTHNYISLMKNGNLIYFSSVEEGLRSAAKALHNNYLTEGGSFYFGKTLTAVKTRFCPASSTWVDLVYGRMQQII